MYFCMWTDVRSFVRREKKMGFVIAYMRCCIRAYTYKRFDEIKT